MAEKLEQEISKLEEEYSKKRAEVERKYEEGKIEKLPSEKETLREAVGEGLEKMAPPEEPALGVEPSAPKPEGEIPSYQLPEFQLDVQKLVDIAFEKSIAEAVKEVRATHNPALIDAFHDALVDNLYDQLVERGKIKELKLAA
jgi:hypothetical protein